MPRPHSSPLGEDCVKTTLANNRTLEALDIFSNIHRIGFYILSLEMLVTMYCDQIQLAADEVSWHLGRFKYSKAS